MYRTDFWTLWEKTRVGCFKRTALKHVYYPGWNRSPAQVGCMRQVLGPGALGRPRGIAWRGRWDGGSGWGIHVNPWLIHINVWQKLLQYCKVISLQLINEKKKKKSVRSVFRFIFFFFALLLSNCSSSILEKSTLSPLNNLVSLSNTSWLYLFKSIAGLSFLLYWSKWFFFFTPIQHYLGYFIF